MNTYICLTLGDALDFTKAASRQKRKIEYKVKCITAKIFETKWTFFFLTFPSAWMWAELSTMRRDTCMSILSTTTTPPLCTSRVPPLSTMPRPLLLISSTPPPSTLTLVKVISFSRIMLLFPKGLSKTTYTTICLQDLGLRNKTGQVLPTI